MFLLEIKNLTVKYGNFNAVSDVNLSLNQSEILGIVGESGSGKTTLLKTAIGIGGGVVSSGEILFNGEDILKLKGEPLRRIRGKEIGFIFQNCGMSLCPVRTIGSQLLEALNQSGKVSKSEALAKAEPLCRRLRLGSAENILKRYPFELSGGMNQRVGILMAMIQNPKLILADEPTSALDVCAQAEVAEMLLDMKETFGAAMIVVTHQIGVAAKLADKLAVMKDGKIIERGDKADVINNPATDYAKLLIASAPKL